VAGWNYIAPAGVKSMVMAGLILSPRPANVNQPSSPFSGKPARHAVLPFFSPRTLKERRHFARAAGLCLPLRPSHLQAAVLTRGDPTLGCPVRDP